MSSYPIQTVAASSTEPTLAIVISSICGTIAILTTTIAVAVVKYDRWKRNIVTESTLSPDNLIPLNEINTLSVAEYQEIEDVDNNPQGSSRNADIWPNNQSTEDFYQSLHVCRENPYLRINERPALQDENVLEETNTSNYEQMRRSQIGDHDDAYQKLGTVVLGAK